LITYRELSLENKHYIKWYREKLRK
jgi:hypothetical protein